jgi:hypothetical protein
MNEFKYCDMTMKTSMIMIVLSHIDVRHAALCVIVLPSNGWANTRSIPMRAHHGHRRSVEHLRLGTR